MTDNSQEQNQFKIVDIKKVNYFGPCTTRLRPYKNTKYLRANSIPLHIKVNHCHFLDIANITDIDYINSVIGCYVIVFWKLDDNLWTIKNIKSKKVNYSHLFSKGNIVFQKTFLLYKEKPDLTDTILKNLIIERSNIPVEDKYFHKLFVCQVTKDDKRIILDSVQYVLLYNSQQIENNDIDIVENFEDLSFIEDEHYLQSSSEDGKCDSPDENSYDEFPF